MPIHDWTRVTAGTWHDFHLAWIAEIRTALNSGILPADYYAQAEQVAGPLGPDVLTLHVPGAYPNGFHGAVWSEFCDSSLELPSTEPLSLAAYSAGPRKPAYLEPTAVGRELIDMPLFLEPETYVNVPLEVTYRAAYRGVPRRWQ